MGTEILRSQDCLRGNRFRHETLTITPPIRSRRSPTIPIPYPASVSNASNSYSRRRKRSPVGIQSSSQKIDGDRPDGCAAVSKVPVKNMVMGQVKILKRGEVLSSSPPEKDLVVPVENRRPRSMGEEDLDLVLGSTDRLGPDPETVQKQIRVSDLKVADCLYAGSGTFYSSPPPSSLPLPAFLAKNGAATSDLKRLLRLDLA